MSKTVCYMATRRRDWYIKVQPSINSLLANSPKIDRVVILCEDDVFPYPLPDKVETINVSGQTFFPPDGPNYRNGWSYMVLLRAALAKIFPEEEKILCLDADTIIYRELSGLWDLDMDDYYVAGVLEPGKTETYGRNYINCGVTFWNLDAMREYGAADRYINAINTQHYTFCEQDSLSELFADKILPLDGSWNKCPYTQEPKEFVRIVHFAATPDWYENNQFVKEWRNTWH